VVKQHGALQFKVDSFAPYQLRADLIFSDTNGFEEFNATDRIEFSPIEIRREKEAEVGNSVFERDLRLTT
jgi:hypothetical protein